MNANLRNLLISILLLVPGLAEAQPLLRRAAADAGQVAALLDEGRQRLEQAVEAGQSPAGMIRDEPDAAKREAMWALWLDDLVRRERLDAGELAALRSATGVEPVSRLPHHDAPYRSRPAFRVAARARGLLRRAALRREADVLARRPAAVIEALADRDGDARRFRAAVIALERLPRSTRAQAAERLRSRVGADPGAARAVIELVRADPVLTGPLRDVIANADAVHARSALRLAHRLGVQDLERLALRAVERGDLDGLGISTLAAAGGDVDAVCWTLLADPRRGADAARALASGSTRLVDGVRERIAASARPARLRMLLALKLRGSAASMRLLREYAGAAWLTDQQRREVAAWIR